MRRDTGFTGPQTLLLSLALACVGTVAAPAHAEDGVAAGSLQLRPGIRLELGVDSSPLYLDASQDPQPSGTIRINPYIGISTPEPRALELFADLGAAWEQLLQEDASGQSGLDLEAAVGLRVNPNGVVSITPSDHLSWTNTPNSRAGDPFRVLHNRFDIEVGLHPGGYGRSERLGRSGALGFQHRVWDYDSFDSLNRTGLGGRLELQWNFLPKTGVFITGAVDTLSYDSVSVTSVTSSGAVEVDNVDSLAIRASAGFTGFLSRRLSLLASGGFGQANYDLGEDAKTYLTHIEFGVHLSDTNRLRFGWEHNFEDAVLSNFITYHRVYADASVDAGALGLGLGAYVNLNTYSSMTSGGTEVDVFNGERKDTLVGGQALVSYSVTDWFTMGLRYNPTIRDSTTTVSDGSTAGQSADYVQHRALFFLDIAAARPLPLSGVSGSGSAWVPR